MIRFLTALLCFLILSSTALANERPVYVLTMDGAIGPAFANYLDSGIKAARDDNAQALIIELATPGGLLSTTRDMVTSILESPVPVIVWVTPSGSHAASAGTFILYAAHIAAMDKGTNIGAATPIEMRQQTRNQLDETAESKGTLDKKSSEIGDQELTEKIKELFETMQNPNAKAMHQKALEDSTAFIRGLAELRGRNAEWAEKAVIEASSLTAEEALEKNVIDLIAQSRHELLDKVDGQSVPVKNTENIVLQTKDAPVIDFPPDWRTNLLSMITDPNIAFILMSIGIYGLILEFYNPGTMIPGTIGAICLILALFALNILPVNAAGIALMVLGVAFMMAEAFIPSFGILGFGGLAAFIFGAAVMFDTASMPGMGIDWNILWGIAFLGAIIMALVIFVTAKVYRTRISTGTEGMIGEKAKVVEWNGSEGRVHIQGEIWAAFADEKLALKEGDAVLVCQIKNLSLKIQAA